METNLRIFFTVTNYDNLDQSGDQQLIGGFSRTFSVMSGLTAAADGNNCLGANCTSGCGGGQNLSSCNTVLACGSNHTPGCM